jgi:ABC-type branched-subunit amino acid transport system permease subunit
VLARGSVSVSQGGAQSVIAGEAHVGSGAFVGAVLSPKVTIEDGARVLMSTPQAAAFGAAFGALLALVAFRRRR